MVQAFTVCVFVLLMLGARSFRDDVKLAADVLATGTIMHDSGGRHNIVHEPPSRWPPPAGTIVYDRRNIYKFESDHSPWPLVYTFNNVPHQASSDVLFKLKKGDEVKLVGVVKSVTRPDPLALLTSDPNEVFNSATVHFDGLSKDVEVPLDLLTSDFKFVCYKRRGKSYYPQSDGRYGGKVGKVVMPRATGDKVFLFTRVTDVITDSDPAKREVVKIALPSNHDGEWFDYAYPMMSMMPSFSGGYLSIQDPDAVHDELNDEWSDGFYRLLGA